MGPEPVPRRSPLARYVASVLALGAAHLRALGALPRLWRDISRARRAVDSDFYLRSNPDVAAEGLPAPLHYALYGAAEGRAPAPYPGFWRDPGEVSRPSGPTAWPASSEPYAAAEAYYDERDPEVSIVVLNLDRADLTSACLESLWRHTAGHRYEVVVVDNGSRPEDFRVLASSHGAGFRLLRLPTNRFFGEGNNLGAEIASAPNLLFLNNDTLVTPGWLPPLMKVLSERADAGAVGATLLYPDGRVQEAGAQLRPDATVVQRRKGSPLDPTDSGVEPVDYCSAAALLVRRTAFEGALGFDLAWEPAYYEDCDLCLKLARAGWKTYHCAASRVIHLEHATTAEPGHPLQCGNVAEINRGKFLLRWASYLAHRDAGAPPVAETPRREEPRSASRSRLGLYAAHALIPGGGERYLLTIAEAARERFDVTLVTDAPYSRLRVLQLGRELGLDLEHVDRSTIGDLAARPRFDVFVAMDTAILPAVAGCGAKNVFVCQFPFPMQPHVLSERWGRLDRYERVVVYSAFARRHTLAALRALPGRAGLPVDVVAPPVLRMAGSDAARGPVVLSVGRFYAGGHPKRHDVLIDALREVHAALPSVELHIAGALHPEAVHREHLLTLQERARGLPVSFHVNPSPALLKDLYARASVYWHAAGYGAAAAEPEKMEHFGIAVVEAMSAGCIPVCFSGGGLVELVTADTGFLYETPGDLRDLTLGVLASPNASRLSEMRRAAIARSAGYDSQLFAEAFMRLVS
jgi:GT2 family glycosyltransferase/glycosyltransferase involved in cell wall biosynthesis